tara:strand:- start:37 stop:300 length:264 start_codon:yes stop_codon:yes gene_type:complete
MDKHKSSQHHEDVLNYQQQQQRTGDKQQLYPGIYFVYPTLALRVKINNYRHFLLPLQIGNLHAIVYLTEFGHCEDIVSHSVGFHTLT